MTTDNEPSPALRRMLADLDENAEMMVEDIETRLLDNLIYGTPLPAPGGHPVKLYTLTITAHIDDLDTLDVHLDADVKIAGPSLQSIAMSAIPAHLRKVANDVEQQS